MIASRQNRTLKDIRRCRRSKGDHALLEGPHLVGEALAAGLRLDVVLATPEFLDSTSGRWLAAALPHPAQAVAAHLLDELADADSPRGVLALAHLPRGGVELLPVPAAATYLYVEGLQDPGNLGALARVAEAAGAAGMALAGGTVHPNHPRALRASAGSLLRLPVATGAASEDLDRHLARPGVDRAGVARPTWIALVPRGGVDLYSLPAAVAGPLVLALGAEGPGVSPALLAHAGLRLTIPVAPPVESLNATVAAALVLYELRRRRTAENG
jgi:TrmH family RNA methyltransferase